MVPNDALKRYFIAFDFETTGLSPFFDRIVEFGAVKFDHAGTVVETFHELANPGRPIPPQVTAVHGITDAAVRRCPPLERVTPVFRDFLGPSTNLLFAHNAAFDTRFLAHELARNGLPLADHTIFDTIDMARHLINLDSYRLESVARVLQIRQSGAHRALADALTVKDIVLEFLRRNKVPHAFSFLESRLQPLSLCNAGIEYLDLEGEFTEIWAAIQESRETTIVYDGGSHAAQPRRVAPKGAYAYKQRRYLAALCLQDNRMKTFCLDRIANTPKDSARFRTVASAGEPGKTCSKPSSTPEGAERMDWPIDVESDVPVFKQIQKIIRQEISSGRLTPGTQLPSVREMAEVCAVNTNTVSHALRELQLQGIIYTRRGAGVFVSDPLVRDDAEDLLAYLEPDDAEMMDLSDEADDIPCGDTPLAFDALGRTFSRVFAHLDRARTEAQASGLDWNALVQLYNASKACHELKDAGEQ